METTTKVENVRAITVVTMVASKVVTKGGNGVVSSGTIGILEMVHKTMQAGLLVLAMCAGTSPPNITIWVVVALRLWC